MLQVEIEKLIGLMCLCSIKKMAFKLAHEMASWVSNLLSLDEDILEEFVRIRSTLNTNLYGSAENCVLKKFVFIFEYMMARL